MDDSIPQSTKSELLGAKIDKLAAYKARKAEIELDLKNVESMIEGIEEDIRDTLDAAGTMESKSSSGHKVEIVESTVPHVEDWDQFYDFIHQNKYYHMLQKRPSTTGYRELITMGKQVPGVLPFTTRKITFTGA
jgi:hypothetical protein